VGSTPSARTNVPSISHSPGKAQKSKTNHLQILNGCPVMLEEAVGALREGAILKDLSREAGRATGEILTSVTCGGGKRPYSN
jgi:hypothetical protein